LSKDKVPQEFYKVTDDFRFIKGITTKVIEIPLVEIILSIKDKDLDISNTYIVGLIDTLPDGVALLLPNDIVQVSRTDSGTGQTSDEETEESVKTESIDEFDNVDCRQAEEHL